jgi:xylitol oxidase
VSNVDQDLVSTRPRTNWAGNIAFAAPDFYGPAAVAELRAVVARARRVRVLATGHSFNDMADSPGAQVSLASLPPEVDVDSAASLVRVSAALSYAQLASRLDRQGFALRNLASLPHISVAGACATGTHGSGNSNGSLATAVIALDMVTADGSLVTTDRRAADFPGMVVALGALGIVTSMTLRVEPAFTVRQWVYEGLSREQLVTHVEEIFAAAYSVSVFTDWRHASRIWVKQRDGDPVPPPHWLGALQATEPRHPVPGMPAGSATQQLGRPGPWHERLPHFRPEFTPSSGDELQSEYLVPRDRAADAITALTGIADQIAPVLLIAEIRTVAADDLWLSMAYGRDSVAFHFTWRPDTGAVRPVLAQLEERLAPFDPRPHWGKLFTMDPRGSYERLPGFTGLMERYDPAGTFRNDFIARSIG